ncbi:hypothetical protein [Candidatus Pelagibacter sp. RS39]|uniref:hypothetical protein n=1 Tax=Candidatus Pelagibacter sp. RS39 TaxID=1977864 RepID=UPI000A167AB8|nr:hypothetical protein [Candidatus Pelagibacter sp. RS39]ARJ47404.1 hypothetical protein B5L73_01020 [Candidatus Pelagibacter sp. RS39]
MKILKLLNKIYLSILIIFFFSIANSFSQDEPVDIWNIDKEQIQENSENKELISISESELENEKIDVFNMQTKDRSDSIKVDETLNSKEIKIIGLYDPEDFGLKIDMWSNSNGDQLKYLFSNLAKIDLSQDASELMNIILLTNAYYPKKNISEKDFLKIKSDWLIKHNDLELIEEYLIKNDILNLHPKLSKYLVDRYLSETQFDKACKIFLNNSEPITDNYLSKFNIYCLINNGKKDEAQLIFDLKKELGFNDQYFENKLNYLFGYTNEIDKTISEKSILEFHLAHKTNPEFSFDPKENTNPLVWKYLAASNLLYETNEIDLNELEKIELIEFATHNKNYLEDDLFQIYKRFQFTIDQFLNVKTVFKSLTNIESRALLYQSVLLESDINRKIELMKLLKEVFIKDKIGNAFEKKLKDLLQDIELDQISSKHTSFYLENINTDEKKQTKIKYNDDLLHQSKLIKYFIGDYNQTKIEKDLNNFLKKIKKDKKYSISKKDIILIESLKSDGIKIDKKYDNLYKIQDSEMPTDIQVMINNNDSASTILRIIEVIGQDELSTLDQDTLFFIISALNQLDIDSLRNKILLKVLPLKV